MSFGIYLAGFIVMIVGLAIGAHLMHVPPNPDFSSNLPVEPGW